MKYIEIMVKCRSSFQLHKVSVTTAVHAVLSDNDIFRIVKLLPERISRDTEDVRDLIDDQITDLLQGERGP